MRHGTERDSAPFGDDWPLFVDERQRIRSAPDIATDMANVGARRCRIGKVTLRDWFEEVRV